MASGSSCNKNNDSSCNKNNDSSNNGSAKHINHDSNDPSNNDNVATNSKGNRRCWWRRQQQHTAMAVTRSTKTTFCLLYRFCIEGKTDSRPCSHIYSKACTLECTYTASKWFIVHRCANIITTHLATLYAWKLYGSRPCFTFGFHWHQT